MEKVDLHILAEKWPSAIVSRDKIEDFTGGLITSKTLANLDSAKDKEGPPGRIRIGRKVVYPVIEFVKWLEARAEILD
jgi:hypothetical protein